MHTGEVSEDLATTWKLKALQAVNDFMKPVSTHVVTLQLTPELEELRVTNAKLKETISRQQLQLTFKELEEKTVHMDTTYGMYTKTKELEELTDILLVEDTDGPTAVLSWIHGLREKLLTPMVTPADLEEIADGSGSPHR
ncbi:hypothetical protein R1sor_009470 [Riccia sorocarpa]|uniref:Uncharacterized protein n=1 Tax=Riccia sorocarpa TaxID=122646 RepID=A0ABD3HX74_9MARC